jgi:hypothetical protein
MTERHEDPRPGLGRPISTGEFRATPDVSATTAQFQAFADSDAEPERPWDMRVPGRSVAKMAMLVVVVAVVLAAIAILVVTVA